MSSPQSPQEPRSGQEDTQVDTWVEALRAERAVAYAAWQKDVFNPETIKALEKVDDRLRAALRAQGEAEGAEYPSNARYYAEVGEAEEDDDA